MRTIRNAILVGVVLASCAAPQREQFSIHLRAQSDDGQLLAGVQVFHGEQELGTTTSAGSLNIAVEAVAGSSFAVQFDCPKGYRSEREGLVIPLRHTSQVADEEGQGDDNALALTLECRPSKRKATIVVKANLEHLRVMLGNQELARTNAEGVAYITLNFPPKKVFELSLDTNSEPLLYPKNPHFPFVMSDKDEVFVLQESFRLNEPPPPPPPPAKPKKHHRRKPPKKEEPKKPTRPTRVNPGER